ncbi:uncharacterized protein N7483_004532 [Penicillium malachiteum]|uniref:uncharacterized protein n=1 Tax=Penicillium malachiteum TaxID=1324776 RepID=UPI002549A3BE|nr:uncharacterized protein N7483_004532 [Penicillium malachiteum]KAJ5730024.1 hypothetical protein N7483_004532 [Penicillium malachiteum]
MPRPQTVTIAESFDAKLPGEPDIEITFKKEYREMPPSSAKSTVDTDAPPAYTKLQSEEYWQIATDALHRSGARQRSTLGAAMPALENGHSLTGEADVLRLSILQHFTWSILPCNHWFHRATKSWPEKLEHLAVLEMQATHVIHEKDFMQAAADTPAEYKKKVDNGARFEKTGATWLSNNALWLSKQAAKYGEGCRHVAIFDWMAMFIFDFTRKIHNAYGLFFRKSKSVAPDRMNYCRLLLAFVVRALNEWCEENGVQPVYFGHLESQALLRGPY